MGLLAESLTATAPRQSSPSLPQATLPAAPEDERTGTGLFGLIGNFGADIKDIVTGLGSLGGQVIQDVKDVVMETATLGGAETNGIQTLGILQQMPSAILGDIRERYGQNPLGNLYEHPGYAALDLASVAGAGGFAGRAATGTGRVAGPLGRTMLGAEKTLANLAKVEELRSLQRVSPYISRAIDEVGAAGQLADEVATAPVGRLGQVRAVAGKIHPFRYSGLAPDDVIRFADEATVPGSPAAAAAEEILPLIPASTGVTGIESLGALARQVSQSSFSTRMLERLTPRPMAIADPVSGYTTQFMTESTGARNPLVRAVWSDPVRRKLLTTEMVDFQREMGTLKQLVDNELATPGQVNRYRQMAAAYPRMVAGGAEFVAKPIYGKYSVRLKTEQILSKFAERGIHSRGQMMRMLSDTITEHAPTDPDEAYQLLEGLDSGKLQVFDDVTLTEELTTLGYPGPEDAAKDLLQQVGRYPEMTTDFKASLYERMRDGRINPAETFRYVPDPELQGLPERARFEEEMRVATQELGLDQREVDLNMAIADTMSKAIAKARGWDPDAVFAKLRMQFAESAGDMQSQMLLQRTEKVFRGAVKYRNGKPYLDTDRLANLVREAGGHRAKGNDWYPHYTQAVAEIAAGLEFQFAPSPLYPNGKRVRDVDLLTDLIAATSLESAPGEHFADALRIWELLREGRIREALVFGPGASTPKGVRASKIDLYGDAAADVLEIRNVIDPDTGKSLVKGATTSRTQAQMVMEIIEGHGVRDWGDEVSGAMDAATREAVQRGFWTHREKALWDQNRMKVRSFAENGRGDLNKVTLDRRMGFFFGVMSDRLMQQLGITNPKLKTSTNLGRRGDYRAMEAWITDVTARLNETARIPYSPAEVQAILWNKHQQFLVDEIGIMERKVRNLRGEERAAARDYLNLIKAEVSKRRPGSEDYLQLWKQMKKTPYGRELIRKTQDWMDPAPLAQQIQAEIMGATLFGDDFNALIRLYRTGNFTTLVHEGGHVLRRFLPDEVANELFDVYLAKVHPGKTWDEVAEAADELFMERVNRSAYPIRRWASYDTTEGVEIQEGALVKLGKKGDMGRVVGIREGKRKGKDVVLADIHEVDTGKRKVVPIDEVMPDDARAAATLGLDEPMGFDYGLEGKKSSKKVPSTRISGAEGKYDFPPELSAGRYESWTDQNGALHTIGEKLPQGEVASFKLAPQYEWKNGELTFRWQVGVEVKETQWTSKVIPAEEAYPAQAAVTKAKKPKEVKPVEAPWTQTLQTGDRVRLSGAEGSKWKGKKTLEGQEGTVLHVGEDGTGSMKLDKDKTGERTFRPQDIEPVEAVDEVVEAVDPELAARRQDLADWRAEAHRRAEGYDVAPFKRITDTEEAIEAAAAVEHALTSHRGFPDVVEALNPNTTPAQRTAGLKRALSDSGSSGIGDRNPHFESKGMNWLMGRKGKGMVATWGEISKFVEANLEALRAHLQPLIDMDNNYVDDLPDVEDVPDVADFVPEEPSPGSPEAVKARKFETVEEYRRKRGESAEAIEPTSEPKPTFEETSRRDVEAVKAGGKPKRPAPADVEVEGGRVGENGALPPEAAPPSTPPPVEPPPVAAAPTPPSRRKWTREMEEAFAEDMEKYVYNNVISDRRMLPAFQALKETLGELWRKVRGFAIEQQLIPEEAVKVFDEYLGSVFEEWAPPIQQMGEPRRTRSLMNVPDAKLTYGDESNVVQVAQVGDPRDLLGIARAENVGIRRRLMEVFGEKNLIVRLKDASSLEAKIRSGKPITDAFAARVVVDNWQGVETAIEQLRGAGYEVLGMTDNRAVPGLGGKRGVTAFVVDAQNPALTFEVEIGTNTYNRFRNATYAHDRYLEDIQLSRDTVAEQLAHTNPQQASEMQRLEMQLQALEAELEAGERVMAGYNEMLVDEIAQHFGQNIPMGQDRDFVNNMRLWNAMWDEQDLVRQGYFDFRYILDRNYLPQRLRSGAEWSMKQSDFVGGKGAFELDDARAAAGLPSPVYFPHIKPPKNFSDFIMQKSGRGQRKLAENKSLRQNRGTLFEEMDLGLDGYITDVKEAYSIRAARAIKMRDTYEMIATVANTFGRKVSGDTDLAPGEALLAPDFTIGFFKAVIGIEDRMAKLMMELGESEWAELLTGMKNLTPRAVREQAPEMAAVAARSIGVGEKEAGALLEAIREVLPEAQKEILAVTTQGIDMYAVPKQVLKTMEASIHPKLPPAFRVWWDGATDLWRGATLYLRPAWVANNIFGNVSFSFMQGVPLHDVVMQGMDKEYRRLADEIAASQPGVQQSGFLGTEAQGKYSHKLGVAEDTASGQFLQALSDAGSKSKVTWPIRKLADFNKSLNIFIEDRFRTASYITALKRMDPGPDDLRVATMKSAAKHLWTSKKDMEQMLADGITPQRAERALGELNHFFGNYSQMTSIERNVIRRFLVPFWGFYKHVAKMLIHMPFDQPLKFAVLRGVSVTTQDMMEQFGPVPEWMEGMVPFGGDRWLSTAGPNPFNVLTESGLSLLHPMVKVFIEQQLGRDTFTGRPFTDPNVFTPYGSDQQYRIVRDDTGQPIDAIPIENVTPSLATHLLSQVPQYDLLRNVAAGGRAYDTQGIVSSLLGGPALDYSGETARPVGLAETAGKYLGLSTFPFDQQQYATRLTEERQAALTMAMNQWQGSQ